MAEKKKTIQTMEEYYVLLDELEAVWEAKQGTPEYLRLEELSELLDEFEKRTFPINAGPVRTGGRF